MTLTPMEQRHENDILGLSIVAMFRWIRVQELGHLMRPNCDRHGYVQASQMVKSWVERELVILRKLPHRAGTICVLALAGVRLLALAGITTARTGKDIGKETAEGWQPGNRWRHDLLAHGALVRLAALGYDIYPEFAIRQGGLLAKIPDGLAIKGKDVLVLEVERAHKGGLKDRKNGRPADGNALAKFAVAVASGKSEKILKYSPTRIGIVFDAEEKDVRDCHINHPLKVSSLIKKVADDNVTVTWFSVKTQNFGVVDMSESQTVITANGSGRILKNLNSGGWHLASKDPTECIRYFANHSPWRAEIMLDESQVNDAPGNVGDWSWTVIDSEKPSKKVMEHDWRWATDEADAKAQAAAHIATLPLRR